MNLDIREIISFLAIFLLVLALSMLVVGIAAFMREVGKLLLVAPLTSNPPMLLPTLMLVDDSVI